jgi:hypothetical protein
LKLIAALFIVLLPAAYGHHAFDAEFDVKTQVNLKGKVTKVELINPHSWIHMKSGEQSWMVECGSPNALFRAGMKPDILKVGTTIVVRGYQSRDKICKPACKANGRDVTFTDGRRVFIGSPGTGAPYDSDAQN